MSLGPVLIGIDGTELDAGSRRQLMHPLVGGVVLFARNFESREQVKSLIQSIRGLRSPRLLLAVDQEGGRVQRFTDGFTRLPPLGVLGNIFADDQEKGCSYAHWHGRLMATEMLAIGMDISFTPVLDLDRGSSVIGDRAFAGDPDSVIALGAAYLEGMRLAGMKSTGKHFPGHGTVEADSHVADVCDDRSLEEIVNSDMRPFKELAGSLDAMMIAHVVYPCLSDKPAGYSRSWLLQKLRQEMAYRGVIFSDDLGMHAATLLKRLEDRYSASLEAGCDAVLVCQPADVCSLLDAWTGNEQPPDVTAKLQSLYGLPPVAPGGSSAPASGTAEQYSRWRRRLENLAQSKEKGQQNEPE